MAKAPVATPEVAETEIETPIEQTENQELFGQLSEDDKVNVGFTDEEIAQMSDGEEPQGEPETPAGEGEGEGEEPAAGAEETVEEQAEPETPAAEDPPADTPAEPTATDDGSEFDEHPLMDTRTVLPAEWQLPQDARANLQQLDQQAAQLATAFDEGNMSAADYRRVSDQLDTQRNGLRSDIRDAERAFDKAQMHWEGKTVAKFFRDVTTWKANDILINAFDAEVRRLQARSQDPFDPRILLMADRNLRNAMGLPTAGQPATAADPKPVPTPKTGKPAANKVPPGRAPEVPPTLARIPADEINDTEGGKWARLDRLAGSDPLAYQDALNRMSDAEREAYLAAA